MHVFVMGITGGVGSLRANCLREATLSAASSESRSSSTRSRPQA